MREWIIRLGLIAFGFAIGIVILEFGLSKFVADYRAFRYVTLHEPDEYIGNKGIPNKEGRIRHGGIKPIAWLEDLLMPVTISSLVKMNSHGFRDKERTYEKEKDIFRIVVLGDSFTDGLQVDLNKTYPAVLEEKLNSRNNKTFEVINLGVRGFNTAQEYLTLKHYGLKYHPDLVILELYIGNDISDNSPTLKNDPYCPYFVLNNGKLEEIPPKIKFNPNDNPNAEEKGSTGQFQILKDFLGKFIPNTYYSLGESIDNTHWLANFLWKIGIKNSKPELKVEVPEFYSTYAKEYSPEWEDAWEVTKALILKLANELEMNKIGFLVVIIPNVFEFRPDIWNKILDEYPKMRAMEFDVRKPERILSTFLEANKVDYLLLRPGFEKYTKETGKDLHFYRIDSHWNADGHALTAKLIYKKLKEDKLVSIKKGE